MQENNRREHGVVCHALNPFMEILNVVLDVKTHNTLVAQVCTPFNTEAWDRNQKLCACTQVSGSNEF